jgi:hypothetical protein
MQRALNMHSANNKINRKAEIIRLWCPSRLSAYAITRYSTSNFISDVSSELRSPNIQKGGVICRERPLLMTFKVKFHCACAKLAVIILPV